MENNNQAVFYENWPRWVKMISAQQWNYVTTDYLMTSLLSLSIFQFIPVYINDLFITVFFANILLILVLQLKASLWIDRHSNHEMKIGWSFKRVLLNIPVGIVLFLPSIVYYFCSK